MMTRFCHSLQTVYPDLARHVTAQYSDADVAKGLCFAIGDRFYIGVRRTDKTWTVLGTPDPRERGTPSCKELSKDELAEAVMDYIHADCPDLR